MAVPDTLYFLEVVPGGNTLPYRKKGGGKFTRLADAQNRQRKLTQEGVATRLWVIHDAPWELLEEVNPE